MIRKARRISRLTSSAGPTGCMEICQQLFFAFLLVARGGIGHYVAKAEDRRGELLRVRALKLRGVRHWLRVSAPTALRRGACLVRTQNRKRSIARSDIHP